MQAMRCLCTASGHRHPWCSLHGVNTCLNDPLADCYDMNEWVKWKVETIGFLEITFTKENEPSDENPDR